eukprot:jgi/Psemu1/307732/fgenesh1_kg.351_\
MDQTESTLLCKCWPSLRESVNTLQAAVSAYDRADTDYVNRARSRARSRAADAIATATATATARTTTTDADADAEESQARHELETARKLVEVACERYSSSIHRLFDECNARIYELTTATTTTTTTAATAAGVATCTATVPVPVTPGTTTTTTTAHSNSSNDIHNRTMEELESLLDEQRNFVFRDMERHYEAAIAQHKIRWDRARGAIERPSTTTTSTIISTSGGGDAAAAAAAVAAANVRATLQTALDSSEKVVDAIESTKMNISVDWWTFREAMNQWIQTTRDNHSLSPRNRVYIGLFDTRAQAHTQNSKLDDNGINGSGGGGSSSKSIDHNGMGGGDFEPDGFCVPSIDSISLY